MKRSVINAILACFGVEGMVGKNDHVALISVTRIKEMAVSTASLAQIFYAALADGLFQTGLDLTKTTVT